jgi:predicted secreted protein
MGIATGVALYFVIWWIALFAVLPFWTRPRDATPEEGGWRGTPESPKLGRKMLVTTVLSGLIWVLIWWLAEHDVFGIRPAG